MPGGKVFHVFDFYKDKKELDFFEKYLSYEKITFI